MVKENGVVGTSNLLEMVPGVIEGQTSGGLFLNSIFDPLRDWGYSASSCPLLSGPRGHQDAARAPVRALI